MATSEDDGYWFTRAEAQEWLKHEKWSADKIAQLRVKEATAFVNDYVSGKLTGKEALKKDGEYRRRWGENPLERFKETLSDEQIVEGLEEQRASYKESDLKFKEFLSREMKKHLQAREGKKQR